MMTTRFLAQKEVEAFLAFLGQQCERLLTPQEQQAAYKKSVVFRPWQKGMPWTLAKATVPPKHAVLPESEVLLTYKSRRDQANGSTLEVKDPQDALTTIVFACRACDAMGFAALDRPYAQGLFKDPYYQARRDKLTVITHTCDSGCQTCFCHWVGGGPTSPAGSDILMTKIDDGFILQPITEKGRELLDKSALADGNDKFPQAVETRRKAWASLKPAPGLADSPKALKSLFPDMDFWTKATDRCISCGACTYFCPDCYCFNITDEGDAQTPKGGRRLRSWDNCMSARYTREASGHNSRPLKSERMRNRVSHKFWTYPENWGAYLCSGCGRCIANCPVNLDIRTIVLDALQLYKSKYAGE